MRRKNRLAELKRIPIRTDGWTPLGSLAELNLVTTPNQVRHIDGARALEILATPTGPPGGAIASAKRALAGLSLPPGYRVSFGGLYAELEQAAFGVGLAALAAFVLMVGILILQFDGLLVPGLLLLEIPLALMGGAIALIVSGVGLNAVGLVAFLTLIGIGLRHGIVLLSRVRRNEAAGMPLEAAVKEAIHVRFRPIVLTALTAALGMLPTALGWGQGAAPEQGLAVVILGGILWSAVRSTQFDSRAVSALAAQTTGERENGMRSFSPVWMIRSAGLFAALFMSGCATYQPKPLPTAPDLAQVSALTVPASQFEIPGLKPHSFPTNGLDETAIVTLAVFNNPDLKAARLQAGVADAQLLEAGLLPDPQVSGGLGQSAFHTGYSIGLSEDLQALITRGAAEGRGQGARPAGESGNSLAGMAGGRKGAGIIHSIPRRRTASADGRRDARLAGRPLSSGRGRARTGQRDSKHGFRRPHGADGRGHAVGSTPTRRESDPPRIESIAGTQTGREPPLDRSNGSQPLSPSQFQAASAALRIAGLICSPCKPGIKARSSVLREAVLAQFPAMSAGVEQARDPVEGVNTIGLTVNMTLPLFNRNRGQIAIQQATRAVLCQTYQARLDQAVSDADQVWKAAQIMARQLRGLNARLPALEQTASAAEKSFQQVNLDAGAYASLRFNFLTEQANAIRLRTLLEQAQSALTTLLGLPFGSQSFPDK